jgi:hypothetical protein
MRVKDVIEVYGSNKHKEIQEWIRLQKKYISSAYLWFLVLRMTKSRGMGCPVFVFRVVEIANK